MGDGYNDRMCHTSLTDDRMCYRPDFGGSELERFRQAVPEAFKLQQKELLLAERKHFEAEFKKLLAVSGITEQEFNVIVDYIRETKELNKELTQRGKGDITLSATDLEQRILATRPQKARFPGTIDPRGYNIGLAPRTDVAAQSISTAVSVIIRECLKPKNWQKCLGTAVSLYLDFLPVIGTIKGLIEGAVGYDLITGAKIPTWARALSITLAAIPGARVGWNLAKLGVKGIQASARVASKAVVSIAFVVAIANKTPAESLRLFKNVAELDETALKVALKEAQSAKGGALPVTKAQSKAMQNLGRLLSADEIADIERAASQKAGKSTLDKATPTGSGKNTPDLPDSPPARDPRPGGSSSARKPKRSSEPKLKPTKITPVEKTEAYKKVGFERKELGKGDQYKPWGRYQTEKSGKNYEQGAKLKDGRGVKVDDLEIDKANPKLLNMVDYKHSKEPLELDQILKKSKNKFDDVFFKELSKSGHYAGFADKIDQFLRQAKLIEENATALNRIIIRCSDSRTAFIYRLVVDNLYGNIFEKIGRKFVESPGLKKIIDEIKIEVVP